ncbi:MAG: molybdopterin-synthase adenylyltransferase MoeB [Myxococcales bacterium]|nr:molybdopterin-synthase adenylyltransferase MoeB [Myxococcales bacterium]
MSALDDRLARLRREVGEVSPVEAAARQARGAILFDIRDAEEVVDGLPVGAVHLSRGFLELQIEAQVPDPATPVLLICAGGVRSLLAGADLRALGYRDVASVAGGVSAWKVAGLPLHRPAGGLDAEARARYDRHLRIPEVGEAGQRRLLDARVLCVGAGGIGSPALLYLAAAGVGTLGIIDDDVVDRSNLQRQVLHADGRVGTPKTESARGALLALNPRLNVEVFTERLTRANVDELVPRYDVIIDGADNFATRYLVNDACVLHGRPNVHGSVHRFEGQVAVFDARHGPCYRCLYPAPPPAELAPSCAEAGVLGVLPGLVGVLQATETLKLLLGLGDALVGRLLYLDVLASRFRTARLPRDPGCAVCSGPFPGYRDDAVAPCAV